MPPEQAAFLSEFWRRATYASRADGDFPFLPPETYWLAEEHLAIKNLIVKFSWTIAEQSEAGMTAVLGKIQGYLTHDTLTRLARERIYRWPDRAA
jgi:hypothetical protein